MHFPFHDITLEIHGSYLSLNYILFELLRLRILETLVD
jgi:hypothetical protein